MSRPARAWSAATIAWASVNCSRNQGSIMALSSGRPHKLALYQRGRGQEPVTVAGRSKSLVAVKAMQILLVQTCPVAGASDLQADGRPRAVWPMAKPCTAGMIGARQGCQSPEPGDRGTPCQQRPGTVPLWPRPN